MSRSSVLRTALLPVALLGLWAAALASPAAASVNVAKPAHPVRLIFIHHSTGENWLNDSWGRLGLYLRADDYFVSDTNYGWGSTLAPSRGQPIGSTTDIGDWWTWFRGPHAGQYLAALYRFGGQSCSYSRLAKAPTGANQIVMFKSCFPNSALTGSRGATVPLIGKNPLRGQPAGSAPFTVANAKGIYIDLLNYFKAHQEKLFIVVTAPPLQDATYAANARYFNDWLVSGWLKHYQYRNVFVFDFFDVLTTNRGAPNLMDYGLAKGNHHRVWNGVIQHVTTGDDDNSPNVLEYPTGSDDHPNAAGSLKATKEFLPLLNYAYNRWKGLAH